MVIGERRNSRLGAIGLGGLPGTAWVRSGGWLRLGPGRGRRDSGGLGDLESVVGWRVRLMVDGEAVGGDV